jgi:hypothetical protein
MAAMRLWIILLSSSATRLSLGGVSGSVDEFGTKRRRIFFGLGLETSERQRRQFRLVFSHLFGW